MPFVPNTPESLLDRSDSKNPTSTCRGITSNGRPCRRPLATAATPPRRRTKKSLADGFDPSNPALYCWQHKEQAGLAVKSGSGTPMRKSSIDTLVDRLGVLDVTDSSAKRPVRPQQYPKKDQRPVQKSRKQKPASTLSFCFCFTVPLSEVQETRPTRPHPQPLSRPEKHPAAASLSSSTETHVSSNAGLSPGRRSHKSRHSTSSQTATILSLIPPSLEPAVASQLLAELARPFTVSEEPGYIYMFWMMSDSESRTPPVEAARSLLAPPTTPNRGGRRASDVVSKFAGNKRLNLKIGRATNVQRRMNQWARQCGYGVEVIRYYPYLGSSSPSTPPSSPPRSSVSDGTTPKMTPHSHRVERLVHIELAGMGLRSTRDECAACGKEHREWFEVESSREAISAVDGVIRRWISWDEGVHKG